MSQRDKDYAHARKDYPEGKASAFADGAAYGRHDVIAQLREWARQNDPFYFLLKLDEIEREQEPRKL